MAKEKYILLVGKHHGTGETGKAYKKGDVLESEIDMETKFPNKFKRYIPQELTGNTVDLDSENADSSDEVDAAKDGDEGRDVTAEFPEAVTGDLKVFKKGGKWNVYDSGELLHDTPLTKKAVAGFVADYLEEG